MEHDINGWKVMGKFLEKDPDFEQKMNFVFGEDFDPSLLRDGEHIMAFHHAEKLISTFNLPTKLTDKLLNSIITARSLSKCRHDLDNFIDFACRRARSRQIQIPCADLCILNYFQPLHETLRDFMKRVSVNRFTTSLPPNSCAFTISTRQIAEDLNLPINSIIVVNGDKPAKAHEMALFQYRNKSLGLGTVLSLTRLRWTAPVIQLYIR